MARESNRFVCQSCGSVTGKWAGRCESCGAWNSISEEAGSGSSGAPKSAGRGRKLETGSLATIEAEPPRRLSGIGEFDRVCGGGLVAGSAILVGGDPGIGKSTLLLQVTAALAQSGARTLYVSGEEAAAQIRLRARRLGLEAAPVALVTETSLKDVLATMEAKPAPDIAIIDSIQTMWSDVLEAAPGTVSQVRAVVHDLVRLAKRSGTILVLVGHVTKDGQIAGPRVVEHMVDTVLYFEGERGHQFRILRAVKNRFGPTDEIGVFEMTDRGLSEVTNPSALFLTARDQWASGSAVFAGIEGTRPLLVEFQALAAPTSYGTPRRAVVGWDSARLSMVIAVLEARCGMQISGQDIYLSVAGGLRISEPGADLAAAAALVSSVLGRKLPADCVIFGEVSLSGAIRPVGQPEARLKEAAKLGFKRAIAPPGARLDGMSVATIETLGGLVDLIREG